jgi:hypothetical protein
MNYPEPKLPQKKRTAGNLILEKRLNKALQGNSYNICLLDNSVALPTSINTKTIELVNETFFPIFNERERAEKIFQWVCGNIKYGNLKSNVGYRNSLETINSKEGICGEMAYVYLILARATNIKSNYVSVRRDFQNKSVYHGCAGIFIPNLILVDPAYRSFDIKHRKYEVLNDKQMISKFISWRY